MNITVIVAHFGGVPAWFPLWAQRARSNPKVDFNLFCDTSIPQAYRARNIIIHDLSLPGFNELPSVQALGLKLQEPYKLCDFRPAFGTIFSDIISSYDYWGWGDLDVIYGDIIGCLGVQFGKYDYIASGWNGASGPLAFLRNTAKVNNLFREIVDYRRKMNDPSPHGLDETDFLEVVKLNVKCDIVFRECLHDLPARLHGGKLKSILSGREYMLHHFGGRYSHIRKDITRKLPRLIHALENGGSIHVGKGGWVNAGDGKVCEIIERVRRRLFAG